MSTGTPPTAEDTISSSNTATRTTFQIADLPTVFADVEPVPQADGPTAVCRIDYPPHFQMAHDYWRAVLRHKEQSEITQQPRTLRLTTLCLEQNAANYTVWQFRRTCLYAQTQASTTSLAHVLPRELAWTAALGGDNPKNYQIWYHRRALLTQYQQELQQQQQQQQQPQEAKDATTLTDLAQSELHYVATVLQIDGKNYHAWSYRQWLLQDIVNDETVWEAELQYTATLIETDRRNNSAWNQRWFVTHRGAARAAGDTKQPPHTLSISAARNELDYAMTVAAEDVFNESPFSYFLAMAKELHVTCTTSDRNHSTLWETDIVPTYAAKLQALRATSPAAALSSSSTGLGSEDNANTEYAPDDEESPFVLSTQVEWYSRYQKDAAQASALLQLLTKVDPIRRKYWMFRNEQLSQTMTTM